MPTSSQVLILADDLSGAADCAVVFTQAGRRVAVAMDDAGDLAAEVISLDLDTRRMEEPGARETTRRIAAALRAPDGPVVYKKIDSTLRGHVFAELAETLPLAPPGTLALVAPAFPAMGRTTLGGRVYVRGVPLEETETWKHAGFTGRANIVCLATRGGLRATQLDLEQVRRGGEALARELERLAAAETQVVICDAVEDGDLDTIADAALRMRPRPLLVGSAGLAHALAGRMRRETGAPGPAAKKSGRAAGPILIVVGSMSSVSREQAGALTVVGVRGLSIAPAALRSGADSPAWREAGESLGTALAAGEDVVVTLAAEAEMNFSEGHFLSEQLAALVTPHAGKLGGLAATGGETARAILKRLGVNGLILEREVEPGVALGVTEGGPCARPLAVITKAGAFGNPQTLVRCREALKEKG